MSLNQRLIKAQFKIDHAPVRMRILVLCGLLMLIMVPWFYLVYSPQKQDAENVATQISTLTNKTNLLRAKYEDILKHAKNHDVDALIVKYNQLNQELHELDLSMTHYRHTYISDKDLARLLQSMLSEMKNVRIENFSTMVINAPPAVSVPQPKTPASVATTPLAPPSTSPGKAVVADVVQEMKHYTLSLKGDYLSIAAFLQHLESLKWQFFWQTMRYHVNAYPTGIITIEFYTLKPNASTNGAAQGVGG